MTRCTATEARRGLFRLLDAVESGEEVIVERRGARFRLTLATDETSDPGPSPLVIRDPELLSGEWTWVADERGELQFQARRGDE